MSSNEKITKETLIPLGLVITLASIVFGVILWGTNTGAKTEQCEKEIKNIKEEIDSYPTREEFNDLKLMVNEIRKDVKTLLRK